MNTGGGIIPDGIEVTAATGGVSATTTKILAITTVDRSLSNFDPNNLLPLDKEGEKGVKGGRTYIRLHFARALNRRANC